jgi:HK97 family phage major capsid protein
MEVGDDWPGMQQEVAGLIADARDQLDATKFLIGSGADEPAGVLTGLSNTQRVQTAGVAAYSVADGWALKAAIQPRYQANASFAASSPSWDLTYRLIGTDSSEPVQFDNGRGGGFLGRPKIEWSTMATGGPTTGAKLIIAGDFRAGFMIADRLGMSMELVPHLFGGSGRPTGQRGFFARWRTGSKVLIPNALRYLEVK